LHWQVRLKIGRDIACALEFLHTAYRQPVIHRDVKSSNILLDINYEAKLSDFGLAMIGDGDGDMETGRQVSVGTRPYMAPEAFQGVVSTKVDVYGLGVTLFELATGLPPYSSKKKQSLVGKSNRLICLHMLTVCITKLESVPGGN
jgi:serine/threonine protein kinase